MVSQASRASSSRARSISTATPAGEIRPPPPVGVQKKVVVKTPVHEREDFITLLCGMYCASIST